MIIYYREVDSPLGRLSLGQHPEGLCLLTLGEGARETFIFAIEKMYPEAHLKESASALEETIDQLLEYFNGQRSIFEIKLFLKGTEFQRQVWSALKKIPYGKTISYGDLAKRLNKPGAMRAVGAANGQNPIPIIIPCHRVIAADGSLGGYTGGLEIKRKLLDLEQQQFTPTLF
ncbi:MAG: methylated-DNA--[protein]-cysteine S-methyltransferase [Candidatus Marinimicrobia bacterium]|nr:methylated-DNA--[protein]-cysteine S-methyltransferase [Candidatus Neomarinimicrobiota bacterium]MCF7921748.1 methylated-DNA--[protein]-cysteine S-methyltransferase [Candidatus Neomarinimicrobiota bacterium]